MVHNIVCHAANISVIATEQEKHRSLCCPVSNGENDVAQKHNFGLNELEFLFYMPLNCRSDFSTLCHTLHSSGSCELTRAWSPSTQCFYSCYILHFHSLSRALLTLQRTNKRARGKSAERDADRKQKKKKKNIFGAMCCRSKTWSHDQGHVIILELHCSFNPSECIFYWGVEKQSWKKAVTSC